MSKSGKSTKASKSKPVPPTNKTTHSPPVVSAVDEDDDAQLAEIEATLDEEESEGEYVDPDATHVIDRRRSGRGGDKNDWMRYILIAIVALGGIYAISQWLAIPHPAAQTAANTQKTQETVHTPVTPTTFAAEPSKEVVTPATTASSSNVLLAQLCHAAYPQLSGLLAKEAAPAATPAEPVVTPTPPPPAEPVPCVPAPTTAVVPADGPVNPISGCPANPDPAMAWGFYVGPQHNVRYPGNMQYLRKDVPFCHYSAKDRQDQPSREQLEGCLQKYRGEFNNDPKQHTKLDCNKRRKVYDIWKFNDEHQILMTRLEEEYDYVDYFVIIESPLAFSNDKKELSFASNYKNYTRFMDKIIHVTCDLSHIPVQNDDASNTGRGWPREFAATDCYKFALAAAAEDDIIIYGDTDEMPRPEVLSALQMCSWELGVIGTPDESQDKVLRLEGPRFVGSWKWHHFVYGESHVGNAVALRRHLNRRNGLWVDDGPPVLFHIRDAIWHCSWCFFGNVDLMVSKLTRWSELGAAKEWALSRDDIKQIQEDCTKSRHPVFNRCRIWGNYDFLPKVVRDHPELWKDKGFTV